jgi:hypothetical protein
VSIELRRLTISFTRDAILYAIEYASDASDNGSSAPGSKARTSRAARIARAGLGLAIEGLDAGEPVWGGFATNTRVHADELIAEPEKGGPVGDQRG